MDADNYQVIYKGEILPGFDKQAVFQEVAQILSVTRGHRLKDPERQARGVEEGAG